MLNFLLRRFIYLVIILVLVSILGFILIQLPPGDYLTSYIAQLEASGSQVSQSEIEALRKQYGLDLPVHMQYFKWVKNMIRGDFGLSFSWNRPVNELIWERFWLTIGISVITLIFIYISATILGIYSALKQYSITDYVLTIWAFIGLATPNFLLALILMYLLHKYLGMNVVGLFSPEFQEAQWSIAKFIDMVKHLPIPVIVIGTAGIAGLFRVLRGCLLDELDKQYVTTARAKGLPERWVLFKYPVRIAINPIISSLGMRFRQIVSGGAIVSIVLGLPTMGPLLLKSLRSQDMYLAGTLILLMCFATVIGTFVSDVLLMVLDPRIKMGSLDKKS